VTDRARGEEALVHVGLVTGLDPSSFPSSSALVDPYLAGPSVERRARSYLDANCAHCHRSPEMDLRAKVPLAEAAIVCRPAGVSNIADAPEIVTPRLPDRSALVRRIGHPGNLRMPPLGTRVPDTGAVAVVSARIEGLRDCP